MERIQCLNFGFVGVWAKAILRPLQKLKGFVFYIPSGVGDGKNQTYINIHHHCLTMERKKEDPEVSARLQEECRARGWTQKNLREGLNISRTFASQIWNGSVPLGPKTLRRLAELGFDLNWLISGQRMMGEFTQGQISEIQEELNQLRFYNKQLERLIKEIGRNDDEVREARRGPENPSVNAGENR